MYLIAWRNNKVYVNKVYVVVSYYGTSRITCVIKYVPIRNSRLSMILVEVTRRYGTVKRFTNLHIGDNA